MCARAHCAQSPEPGSEEASHRSRELSVNLKRYPEDCYFISVPSLWPRATVRPPSRWMMRAARTETVSTRRARTLKCGTPDTMAWVGRTQMTNPWGPDEEFEAGDYRGEPSPSPDLPGSIRTRTREFGVTEEGPPDEGLLVTLQGRETGWWREKWGSPSSLLPLISCQHLPETPDSANIGGSL